MQFIFLFPGEEFGVEPEEQTVFPNASEFPFS